MDSSNRFRLRWAIMLVVALTLAVFLGQVAGTAFQRVRSSDQPKTRAEQISEAVSRMPKLLVGDSLPSLTLEDTELRSLDLSSLRGKRCIVVFFDPECSPCIINAGALKETFEAVNDSSRVVMISAENPLRLRRHKVSYALPYRVLYDSQRRVMDRFGIKLTPTNLLVDSDLHIAAIVPGIIQPTEAIDWLVEGKSSIARNTADIKD